MTLPAGWARHEQDLFWRFHFAEGEVWSAPSPGVGGALYEPILNVRELRCGPLEVTSKQPAWRPGADINWRACEAARRSQRVDAALRDCESRSREVLWRAYGARVDAALAQLGGAQRGLEWVKAEGEDGEPMLVLVVQPLLCNLLELAPEVAALHARSRTPRTLRQWLERQSRKAALGKGDSDVLRELLEGAHGVLEEAANNYASARSLVGGRVLPRRVREVGRGG